MDAYINTFVDKYIRMCKVGHPINIIQQMMSVDVQCTPNDPRLNIVLDHVIHRANGAEVAAPAVFGELLKSKYGRMQEKGISNEKLSHIKQVEDYVMKLKTNSSEPVVFSIQEESETVGQLIDDRVVSDHVMVESDSSVPLSQQRAKQFKKEAIDIRASLFKAAVESKTDDVDTAPLTVAKDSFKTVDGSEQFYTDSRNLYPEPEVLQEKQFILTDISGNEHTCVVRDHLTGKLFTFLNVLSDAECQQLKSLLNFSTAEEKIQDDLINNALNKGLAIIRTNIKRNFVDEQVARLVWRAVKDHLPKELPDGRKLAGIRTKMNYYRYEPGQYFRTHIDGGYRYIHSGETSVYTFVVYLNDDFQDGFTRFCPQPEWDKSPRDVIPTRGGMLVFRQCDMKHCGVTIQNGYKHILQGMVMYGPFPSSTQGLPHGKEPQIFYTTTCDC